MARRSTAVRRPAEPVDSAAIAAELAGVRADRDALLDVLTRIALPDPGFTGSLCRAIAQVAVAGERYPDIGSYVRAACRLLETSR